MAGKLPRSPTLSKFAACIIAWNAESKLRDLLESLKGEVDYLVVGVDSKTTDGTEAVASEFGATVIHFDLDDDFSQARQKTFDAVPDDTEWLFWIDTDDILAYDPDRFADISLRKIADEQGKDVSMVWMPYQYHRDDSGNVTTMFDRERLIRRSFKPKWIGRLHETCITEVRGRHTRDTRMWIEHKNRTEEGKGERNFRILTKMVEEDANDLRAILYMAHQHFQMQHWDEAAVWYRRFLDIAKNAGTPVEERWQASIYLSKSLRSGGDLVGSQSAATRAMNICPQYADAYFEMSHNATQSGAHQRAIEWFEDGQRKKQPDRILIQNPMDYSYNPYCTIHTSYFNTGNTEKALECVETALKLRPNQPELVSAKANYQWALSKKNSFEAAQQLVTFLLDSNEPIKAREVLANLPAGSWEQDDRFKTAKAEIDARLAHLRDETDYENFYVMEAEPDFDPEQVKEVGGRLAWIEERIAACGAKKVLDVGFGLGLTAIRLAQRGVQVVGIDCDVVRVRKANQAAVKMGLLTEEYSEEYEATLPVIGPDSIVQFHYGRAEKYPQKIRDLGPFDAVILGEVIEHLPDVPLALKEAESVSSRVLITTPDGGGPYQWQSNREHPDSNHAGHVQTWSQTELDAEIQKRGRIIESHRVHDQDHILVSEYTTETAPAGPPVVIYCGKALEEWHPDQINSKGLGGSETAVVMLAKELANYRLPSGECPRVRVYGEVDGVWDGVLYRHHSKFVPGVPSWLFIAWRNAAMFDMQIEADLKWAWVHDVVLPNLTPERDAKIDTYMVLSEWHRSNMKEKFPFVAEEKYAIIGNGIDPSRFVQDRKADPRTSTRIIYASSPDRGLDRALAYFPQIRKAIPEATLEVFYGWENYEKAGARKDYRRKIERMLDQPGVTFRGRAGQKDLARELMRAGVLLYPSHEFCETFGITFLEAQAAGCVPVTRDNGALPETNKFGFVLSNTNADINDYIAAIKEGMARSETERFEMSDWAKRQTWQQVAERCVERARQVYKEREEKLQEVVVA